MPSKINPSIPPHGNAYTVGVRDNFKIANAEITELQARIDQIGGGGNLVQDVPTNPVGMRWVRRTGLWEQLNVYDGGTF